MRCLACAQQVIGFVLLASLFGLVGETRAQTAQRLDQFGDPLPPGALARYGTLRLRHGGLQQASFTTDGKHLITYGGIFSQELRRWDLTTGKLLQRRAVPIRDGADAPAIAPDGGVYFLSMDGIDYIKDLNSPKKRIYEKMGFQSMGSSLSPDGKLLVVSTPEGGRVFDVPDGKIRFQLEQGGAGGGVVLPGGPGIDFGGNGQYVFSPDSRLLANSSLTGEITIWDVINRKKLTTYPAPDSMGPNGELMMFNLCFSPDGKYLLAHAPGRARLLETAVVREVPGFRLASDNLMTATFNHDGKELLVITYEGKLHRYAALTGKEVGSVSLISHPEDGMGMAFFSRDRRNLALIENSLIRVLDLTTMKSKLPNLGDRRPLRTVRWASPKEMVSLTMSNQVRIWDPQTGKLMGSRQFGTNEVLLDLDRTGKYALLMIPEQVLRLQQVDNKQDLWKADDLDQSATAQFSPNGRWVVTSSQAGTDIRDLRTGKVKRSWKRELGQPNSSTSLAWSADGRMLARINPDEEAVTIQEFATGQKRCRFCVPQPAGVAFAAVGQLVAISSSDGVIRVFRLGRDKPLFEVVVRGGGGPIHPLAYSGVAAPGGGAIAVDVAPMPFGGSGRCEFTPDGKLLVAVCGNEVRVWDLTGKPVGLFQGHEEPILDLAFSAEGKLLATSSSDGTALIWEMSYLNKQQKEAVASTERTSEQLWADLASDNAEQAFRAMAQLREKPAAALTLFKEKLGPVTPVDAKQVRKWIDDLESDTAATRKQAAAALEALDLQVEAELSTTLTTTKSAEVRRTVSRLLEALEGPTLSPDRLREVRVVEVLETIGSKEARTMLEVLARGADGRLTREAKEALARLAALPQR